MSIRALLAEGQLASAIAVTEKAIRENPLDYRQRTTLFTLLCYIGDFERAEAQLKVLSQEDAEAERGTAVYRGLLAASQMRERVLRGEAAGQCLTENPPYLAAQLAAISHIARADFGAASLALAEVSAKWRPSLFRAGEHIGMLRDADDRIAPFLEIFLHDQYFWLPFESLRGLRIPRPVHERDLIFAPVVVELDAGPMQAFMPVLYPRRNGSADPLVTLGRKTVWRQNDEGLSIGEGARLFSLCREPISEDSILDLPVFEVERLERLDVPAARHESASATLPVAAEVN